MGLPMRLVFTADLHGDIDSYRALLDYAVVTGAQVAIVGGDLLPHGFRLHSALATQRDFIGALLRPLLADFHARHPSITVYLLPGNDDWAAAIAMLAELEPQGLAYPLHQRAYALAPVEEGPGGRAGLWLAGYACVPITPFSIKDYERRDEGPLPPFDFSMAYASWDGAIAPIGAGALADRPSIADDLAALARLSDPRRTIYACHTPPSNTALDQMPRDRHVGSHALRAFITGQQPLLTLHGHIHEAPDESGQYAIQVGATWCINPGHSAERFQAVALDTDDIIGTLTHTVFGPPALTG
jgi:Icc-related predicted phosphoesterase